MSGISQNNPIVANSYFSNFLFYPNFNPRQVNYQSAWVRAWKMLQNSTLFGKSVPTADPEGRFNTIIKNRQSVKGTVINVAQDGSNVIVTFASPSQNNFRIKEKVDNGVYEGYVIAKTADTITLQPLNNPSGTLTAGTHFAINDTVWGRGIISGLYNSTGTTSLYEQKDNQTDWLEITRDTHQVSATEKTIRYGGVVGGQLDVYAYTEGEADMVARQIRNCMYKKFFGQGGGGMQGLEGLMTKTMSIRNRLIDSGYYEPATSVPTQAQFKQALFACADANPGFEQDIMIAPGREFLNLLATWYPNELAFTAGQRNGNQISITYDIREITLSGITAKVIMDFNILNDTDYLPHWHKWSCYFFNRAMTTIDGQVRPLIQPIHFSMNPSSEYKMLYRTIPGMVGVGESDDTGLASIMGFQTTASSTHGASFEVLDFSGISMIPYGHFLIEYIH